MKFEEKIQNIMETLDEAIAGNPVPNNPTQVAPQAGQQMQQPQTGDQTQQPQGQQQEITADQTLDWALSQDPKVKAEFDKLQTPDEKFQYAAQMMQQQQQGEPNAQGNPAAPSNNTQTTSAAPAKTNTSGTMGAGSVQV